MTLFEEVMSKIISRKKWIEYKSYIDNKGLRFDITTDLANDEILNELYVDLENSIPIKFEYDGRYLSITEMSKEFKINESTLRTRLIRYKWSVEDTIKTPIKRGVLPKLSTGNDSLE